MFRFARTHHCIGSMNINPVVFFINPAADRDSNDLLQARLLIKASLLTSLFSATYMILSVVMSFQIGIYLMLFNVAAFLVLPFMIRLNFPTLVVGNLYVFAGTFAVAVLINYSGGLSSPILPWLIATPTLALLLLNRPSAFVWSGVALMAMTYFGILSYEGIQLPVQYDVSWHVLFKILSFSGVLLIIFMINLVFEDNRNKAVSSLEVNNNELVRTLQKLKETQTALVENNRDILEKNQQLEEQKEKNQQQSADLKQINNEKDYIIDLLSHDLKEPLHSVKGLIDLLKTEKDASYQQQYVHMMDRSMEKATDLIDKVLGAGEMEQRKISLVVKTLELDKLLTDLVAEQQRKASAKKIRINTQFLGGASIESDELFTRQIFENLLSNAIKFSPRETEVLVKLTELSQKVMVEVIDQGPGISEAEIKQLFGKYKRLSAKPTAGESTTGLGLSLVKRYVELLGGQVSCSSTLGKGANFMVEFPKAK